MDDRAKPSPRSSIIREGSIVTPRRNSFVRVSSSGASPPRSDDMAERAIVQRATELCGDRAVQAGARCQVKRVDRNLPPVLQQHGRQGETLASKFHYPRGLYCHAAPEQFCPRLLVRRLTAEIG